MSTEATGLEGVVAFATEISEPDRDGGALRYRGVDLGELAGRVPFERVWGLLVDGDPDPGLVPTGEDVLPVRSGDARVDLQAAVAMLAPAWGVAPLIDTDVAGTRDDLARTSSALLSFAAQSARGRRLRISRPLRGIWKMAVLRTTAPLAPLACPLPNGERADGRWCAERVRHPNVPSQVSALKAPL